MRREKKFEVIYKMKFHVTQVPPLLATCLMISLTPVDAEKPTTSLEKTQIVEGTCKWAKLVYETVELVQEIKTGRIREKLYYFIVSTESSESGVFGQVSIDFAALAEATKPRNLTLPLQTSKSGAILHVTVQRMPEDQDSRSTEDGEFLDAETRDHNNDGNGSLYPTKTEALCNESENDQMKMLERKVGVSEKEVESLKQQVIGERKIGEQLSELIANLQQERDVSKTECEQLKSEFASAVQKETESIKTSLEGIKEELQCERHLNDQLKLQLQKTDYSNSGYALASRDLNEKLDQKNTEITQLSSKIKALESEMMEADEEKLLKQTIENLYSEIEIHKKEKEDILMDVKRLCTDSQNLERKSNQMYSTLQKNQKEKMEVEKNYEESLATVKQLNFQVETLEEDIKNRQSKYSELLTVNEELEIQIKNLQKELENQAQVYEESLKTTTEAKMEQEQRAIRAEEAFSDARRDNANIVKRLQQECKQLSDEMLLMIEENEKLVQKLTAEAIDLQQENEVLESLLQKAEEEHQKTRNEYERFAHELEEHKQLSDEKTLKIEEKEKLALKLFAEANDLQGKKEVLESLLQKAKEDHQMTRTEYERTVQELQGQNKRTYIKEHEDLDRQLASMREEVDKLKQENISMKSNIQLKNLKEVNLNLEVKKMRLKNSDLKNYLSQVELEKEDLKKEVLTLQDNFHMNKESAFDKSINASEHEGIGNGDNNSSMTNMKVIDELTKKIELDTAQIKSLLGEVDSLKEMNRSMEQNLEEMHERYSEISLRFAEVEGERQELVMALRNLKIEKKN